MSSMEHDFKAKRKAFAFCACIYLLMVIISVLCLELKRQALAFHTRDYNYFIEQAARLADPGLADKFSLNIEGYNFLGLQGIEGVRNLFHAIHAEYFRYTYAVLYSLFHSPLPIYLFYSLVLFLPLLYFPALIYWKNGSSPGQAILFTLLYALFPAALNAATADLRPRVLFISAWCLVILAVYFDRPFLEKLVFFGLLLSIREEGILLGALVIALNFLRLRDKPGRLKQTLIFLALDAVALAAFLAFMAWGGYRRIDAVYDPITILRNLSTDFLPLILGVAALAAMLFLLFRSKLRTHRHQLALLLIYLTAIPLTGIQAGRVLSDWIHLLGQVRPVETWEVYAEVVSNSLIALPFYVMFLLLVLLLDYTRGRSRPILFGILALLCAVFATTTTALFPGQIAPWRENIPPARLVWDFARSFDHYGTDVLVDYDTYQAFYNFDRVSVYNRLPLWDTVPEKRYYPQNKSALARLIRQRIEYAVIARASLENIQELAQIASVQFIEVAANERYLVLKFQRNRPEAEIFCRRARLMVHSQAIYRIGWVN